MIESLKANRMDGMYLDDPAQVASTVISFIPQDATVLIHKQASLGCLLVILMGAELGY